MWEHCLKGLEADPTSLWRECDWVAKYRLIEEMRGPPRRARSPTPRWPWSTSCTTTSTAAAACTTSSSSATRWTATCTDEAITDAMTQPPETTRARLRGAFVKRAKERRRDFTVDWVHLKLNDQAQRTVLLKDPFKSHDERVERLIASL